MRFKAYWVTGILVVAAQTAMSQNEVPVPQTEFKHVMTTVADTGDPVRMSALQIDKNWTDSTIHLTGQVRLVVGKFSGSGSHAMAITADEVTLNEKTGEILPSGTVRITPYPYHQQ
jgi:lipopolysaccharide assembly outer membrane protein LptD (OstA)